MMKTEVIQNLEVFLNDFHYFKIGGYEVFHHLFSGGRKLLVVNATTYEDGIMIEIQLAVRIDNIEQYICRFYQQEADKLSLSYWESLSQVMPGLPKRSFIQNEIELLKVLAEIEDALVKKGFNWLDQLSDPHLLSNYLADVVFNSSQKPANIFKHCQRSYLLRVIHGEKITEADFYDYYEQLQFYKVPEHQLQEFIELRSHLKVESIYMDSNN